jgi:hypothetical protein
MAMLYRYVGSATGPSRQRLSAHARPARFNSLRIDKAADSQCQQSPASSDRKEEAKFNVDAGRFEVSGRRAQATEQQSLRRATMAARNAIPPLCQRL